MGGGKSTSTTAPRLNGINIQSSVFGSAIPRGWGTFRVPANLLWYGDFQAIATTTKTKTGGKGGGGSNKSTTYSYKAALILGICAGPIAAIRTVYKDQSVFAGFSALSSAGLSLKTGTDGQTVWGHLSTRHPDQAIGYSGIAYAYASAYALSDSAVVSNHSFEVVMPDLVDGSDDASPRLIVEQFLSEIPGWPSGVLSDLSDYGDYCLASGLLLSPVMTAQVQAAEFLQDVLRATNSEAFMSEGKVKITPYGDTEVTGNGVTWTPDLTPVYDLDDSVFIPPSEGDDPLTFDLKRPADAFNIVQVEYLDRGHQYAVAMAPGIDQASIDQFGARKADPARLHVICDSAVADKVADLLVRRTAGMRTTFSFRLPWNYVLLDPMDLVTVTDLAQGVDRVLVRVLEVNEADDEYEIVCEEMLVGQAAQALIVRQPIDGYRPNWDAAPGDALAPLMFNPPRQLTDGALEVWLATAGGPDWGGAEVWASIDGTTYERKGQINGPARYGYTTSSLPLHVDPDSSNTVGVDIALSGGELSPATQEEVDDFATLCMIGDEVIAYRDATLTGTGLYTLGYLRRGLMGTTPAAHAPGTRFVRLDGAIESLPYRDDQIGLEPYIKLRSFNIHGRAYQELDEVDPYTVTLSPVSVLAPAAGSVTAVASAETGPSGTRTPAILVTSTASNPVADSLVIRYRSGAADWNYHPRVNYDAGALVFQISAVQPETAYNVEAAHIIDGALGDFLTLPDVTTSLLTAGDVTSSSPAMLELFYRQVDEMLTRTLLIIEEQGRQVVATTDTQRFIDRIGVVNPATGRVDLRAESLFAGRLSMAAVDERVAEGFEDTGQIRQPIPRDVSYRSGALNDMVSITSEGEIIIEQPDGGPTSGGQVLRVQEATGFLGHDAFVRRSPIDGNQGGRQFFEKPLINTTLSGDLAVDIYQSTMRWFDATTLYGVTLPFTAFQPSIGGRLVVSTPAGVVTGDVASTTALRAPYARIGNDPGDGFVTLVEGDAAYSGRMEFYNGAATRLGYVGFGTGSTLVLAAEGAFTWAFDKQVQILAGATVTGLLTADSLDVYSGGIGLVLGADNGASTRTNVTAKYGRLAFPHYTNAEEPFAGLVAASDGSNNTLSIGGGSGALNSASILAFFTGANTTTLTGTERMRINSAGNLGLGTTAPSSKLDVVGGNNDGLQYRTSTRTVGIGMIAGENAVYWGSGTSLNFTSGGGIPLSISTGGLVGIGTTSPATKLDIVGTNASQLRISNTTSDTTIKNGYIQGRHYTNAEEDFLGVLMTSGPSANDISFGGGSSVLNAATGIHFYTAGTNTTLTGTERMTINSAGNVGIGTASPDGRLHIHRATAGAVTANANGDELVLESNGTTGMSFLSPNTATQYILFGDADDNDIGDIRYNHTDNSLRLTANAGVGYIHLTSAGNVGIGTTAPSAKLHVAGNSRFAGAVSVDAGNYLAVDFIQQRSGSGNLTLRTESGTNKHIIISPDGTGKVGVGTATPGAQFHVRANTAGAATDNLFLSNSGTTDGSGTALHMGFADNAGAGYYGVRILQTGYPSTTRSSDLAFQIHGSTNNTTDWKTALFIQRTTANVGIGTTAPDTKLHVAGPIKLAGSLVRTGADQTFAVDAGQGFHWSVNGTDVALLEANGRLSVNLLSIGGANFDPATKVATTGNETIAGVKTFSSTPVAPGLATVGADMHLKVDTGQGFYFDVNGVAVALLQADGRMSLNAITMGGLGLGEWTDWTPTPVAESGTATGLAMAYAEVERHGKSVTVNFAVSQTAIDTATAAVIVPLPYAAKASRNYFGAGKNFNTGADLRVEAVGSNLRITAANSYPFGSGAESLSGSITYQCA